MTAPEAMSRAAKKDFDRGSYHHIFMSAYRKMILDQLLKNSSYTTGGDTRSE